MRSSISDRLTQGTPAARAISTLCNLLAEADKLRHAGLHPTAEIARNNYLHWVEQVEIYLSPLIAGGAWQQRLLSERYRVIRALSDEAPRPWPTIERELQAQMRWMGELADELERWVRPFSVETGERLVVADTSVYARGNWFADVPWPKLIGAKRARLVVPLVVLDELDDLSH